MMTDLLIREMTATAAEFHHGLKLAFPACVAGQASTYVIDDGGAAMSIDIEPLPPLVIASLQLPRLQVVLRFTRGDPQQRSALLKRMDLAMQRGGG